MTRVAAIAMAAATLVAAAGCDAGPSMRPVPPPAGWSDALAGSRAAKDREFASSPDSPLAEAVKGGFRGLDYWPPDPSARFEGSIERHPVPEPFGMMTTTGEVRPAEKYGRITFERGGARCTLQVYRFLDEPRGRGGQAFFLPFADATTGRTTYPGGRFVDLEGPDGGPFVLDFNRAYNPFCAYGRPDRWQCPVTPAENRLAIAIEAGERGWVRHE